MDQEKRRAERRRNVLENAEARLRFIKEGVPWRNTDSNKDSTVSSSTEDNSQLPQSLNSGTDVNSAAASVDSPVASVNSPAANVNSTAASVESSVAGVNSTAASVESSVASEDSSAASVEKELPTPQLIHKPHDHQAESSCSRLHSVPSSVAHQRDEVEGEETVQRLSRLIEESERERGDRKKDGEETAKRSLHDCILMLCLGVAVRLSYSLSISTLFYQLMMVPFIGVATVRLLDEMRRPPVINSFIMRFLMMIPLRSLSINWTLTVLSTLRTGLQLFSVYLVAFVFTHTLVTSNYESV